jgi:hypothetical protein
LGTGRWIGVVEAVDAGSSSHAITTFTATGFFFFEAFFAEATTFFDATAFFDAIPLLVETELARFVAMAWFSFQFQTDRR